MSEQRDIEMMKTADLISHLYQEVDAWKAQSDQHEDQLHAAISERDNTIKAFDARQKETIKLREENNMLRAAGKTYVDELAIARATSTALSNQIVSIQSDNAEELKGLRHRLAVLEAVKTGDEKVTANLRDKIARYAEVVANQTEAINRLIMQNKELEDNPPIVLNSSVEEDLRNEVVRLNKVNEYLRMNLRSIRDSVTANTKDA
jgi:chromosome segregation ATPase